MSNENTQAVVAHSLADDQLLAVAEHAEKRIEAIKRIKHLALRVTGAYDWTNQGGKPYLQVSGSEKIARLFGISWRVEEPRLEMEEDGHFGYTYRGTFSMGAAEIEAIGTRSSKDKFFSMSKGEAIPVGEIDRGDVKKAAYTNCIGNGITRLLGLRNLSWPDLDTAGIKQESVGKVDYKTKGDVAGKDGVEIKWGRFKGQTLADLTEGELAEVRQETKSDWLKKKVDEEVALRKRQPTPPPAEAQSQPAVQHPNPPDGEPPDYVVDDHAWTAAVDEMEQDSAAFKTTKEKLKVNMARALTGDARVHFVNTFRDVVKSLGKK